MKNIPASFLKLLFFPHALDLCGNSLHPILADTRGSRIETTEAMVLLCKTHFLDTDQSSKLLQ
jgi:hypothetical protein